jgi:DMSO/TMAO reductase YedYZ heme-binding membrane subunit
MSGQGWWYAARATGLVGWGLCTLSVLWGLTLSTRLLGRRAAPAWLLDLHRFLGGLATIFVIVHLGALVADNYVHFGPAELLVPLASAWKPGPVAWGIAGFYLLVAVEVTSLARRRLPVRIWRMAHMASLPLWALSTVHLLTAGTDIGNPLVQWTVLLSTAAVLFTSLVRVLSPRSALRKPRAGSGSGGRGPVRRVTPPGPEQGAGLVQGTTGTAEGPGVVAVESGGDRTLIAEAEAAGVLP